METWTVPYLTMSVSLRTSRTLFVHRGGLCPKIGERLKGRRQNLKTPCAIGFLPWRSCTIATLQFVWYVYQSNFFSTALRVRLGDRVWLKYFALHKGVCTPLRVMPFRNEWRRRWVQRAVSLSQMQKFTFPFVPISYVALSCVSLCVALRCSAVRFRHSCRTN